MLNLIIFSGNLYFRYILIYAFLTLLGRSFLILINKFLLNKNNLPKILLQTNITILYPIIGLFFLGNLLIFFNFFIALKNLLVWILLLLCLLPNFLEKKNIRTRLNKVFTFKNFIFYLFIPSVLLISSSDINFHYDAAYYHLNHQNWLRESNLIIGMVNIFWPFGMSSVYEYISSIFWFVDSLIYLHFISLIFINFFFSFLFYQIFYSENKNLKYGSLFILIFSFFDNFGLNGGRNGFIYIQEIGKQDIAVAVLFCFLSLLMLDSIQSKKINNLDFVVISSLSFFIFELKVSGVFVFFVYIVLIAILIREKKYRITELLYFQLPTIIFGIIWAIKSILTTGCLIFPLSFTCINNFTWYEIGSTERVEEYTTNTSFAYMEYFKSDSMTFINWFNNFFNPTETNVFSSYYRTVYLNFLFSLIAILIIKKLFFNSNKANREFSALAFAYILLGSCYLIFYGPIPRYSIGILCTIVGLTGFYVKSEKIKFPQILLLTLFIFSIGLIPRFNSYVNFINNTNISLADPRIGLMNNSIDKIGDWYKPSSGDRCWVDLNCTMEKKNIIIEDQQYFRVAYKD